MQHPGGMPDDDYDDDVDDEVEVEAPWTRQLLIVVAVLVVVAVVIGGVIGAIALGAAKVTGFDNAAPAPSRKPSLYIPSGKPTVGLDQYPQPSARPGTTASPGDGSAAGETGSPKPKKRDITLQAFPQRVSPGGRINLTGLYRGGEGVRLQVQRFEAGSWTDFPVSAPVSGGQFTTYVTTSRSGVQRFRVVDPGAARNSNPVRVTVG